MSSFIGFNSLVSILTNNLAGHYAKLAKSIERLSTGKRINSAADDPAGYAMSSYLRADISALKQGARNANDAISLAQTADGAMQTINNTLIRMKELAEQASTGTYTSTQRSMMNDEYQMLADEITRIATATEFNGIKLLDGSLTGPHDGTGVQSKGALRVHVGSGNDASDYYDIQIGSATASSLGIGDDMGDATKAGYTIETQGQAQESLVAVNAAIEKATVIHSGIGIMQNRLGATIKHVAVQSENLAAAESRVTDVDIALEMMSFVRNKILAEISVALLSQANSMPYMALALLQSSAVRPKCVN